MQLVKFDLCKKTSKTWSDPKYIPTEPVFVANPNATDEDDGKSDLML